MAAPDGTTLSTAAQQGLAEAIVAFLLAQPLARLVDPQRLSAVLVALSAPPAVRWIIGQIVDPGYRRVADRLRQAGGGVEEHVERESLELIGELIRRQQMSGTWAAKLVDRDALRSLLGPVVQELLVRFARIALSAGKDKGEKRQRRGFANQFLRQVQEGAGKLVDLGMEALGGLSAEMERRVRSVARQFAQDAGKEAITALRNRLASAEGRKLIQVLQDHAIAQLLATRTGAILDDLDRLPLHQAIDAANSLSQDAKLHGFVASVIEAEVANILSELGERRVGELLGELGVLAQARALLEGALNGLVGDFLASPAFAAWRAD